MVGNRSKKWVTVVAVETTDARRTKWCCYCAGAMEGARQVAGLFKFCVFRRGGGVAIAALLVIRAKNMNSSAVT